MVNYMNSAMRFRQALAVAIFLSIGAVPRATEYESIKFANLPSELRNLTHDVHGMVLTIRYGKNDNIRGYSAPRSYNLPRAISNILETYLAFVRPLEIVFDEYRHPGLSQRPSKYNLFYDSHTGKTVDENWFSTTLALALGKGGMPGMCVAKYRQAMTLCLHYQHGTPRSDEEEREYLWPVLFGHSHVTNVTQYSHDDNSGNRQRKIGTSDTLALTRLHQQETGLLHFQPRGDHVQVDKQPIATRPILQDVVLVELVSLSKSEPLPPMPLCLPYQPATSNSRKRVQVDASGLTPPPKRPPRQRAAQEPAPEEDSQATLVNINNDFDVEHSLEVCSPS